MDRATLTGRRRPPAASNIQARPARSRNQTLVVCLYDLGPTGRNNAAPRRFAHVESGASAATLGGVTGKPPIARARVNAELAQKSGLASVCEGTPLSTRRLRRDLAVEAPASQPEAARCATTTLLCLPLAPYDQGPSRRGPRSDVQQRPDRAGIPQTSGATSSAKYNRFL
jgi:hypothetical protein